MCISYWYFMFSILVLSVGEETGRHGHLTDGTLFTEIASFNQLS